MAVATAALATFVYPVRKQIPMFSFSKKEVRKDSTPKSRPYAEARAIATEELTSYFRMIADHQDADTWKAFFDYSKLTTEHLTVSPKIAIEYNLVRFGYQYIAIFALILVYTAIFDIQMLLMFAAYFGCMFVVLYLEEEWYSKSSLVDRKTAGFIVTLIFTVIFCTSSHASASLYSIASALIIIVGAHAVFMDPRQSENYSQFKEIREQEMVANLRKPVNLGGTSQTQL